jgi:protein-S-isoprenylcysteine O-methyltransferase Ste14
VPLGFLCAILFFLVARPRPVTLALGGAIAFLGLGLRAWASGHIRKNDKLAVSGPYAFTRNPLYLGSFIMGLGFTIAAGRLWLGLVFAALFLGIYLPVMRVEAATLLQIFGDDFRSYAGAVPLFFPRVTPWQGPGSTEQRFDRSLYLRYREYQAAIGFLVAWFVLLALSILR